MGRDVAGQVGWDAKSQAVTSAFKAALVSEASMVIPGLVYRDSGEQYEDKVALARGFGDRSEYRILDDFRMEALRSWPALHRIALRAWREDLVPFLESSPVVWELDLEGHGQRDLDFSRTSLEQLSVEVTGLERLVLPTTLRTLTLRGDGTARAVSSREALPSTSEVSGEQSILQIVAEQDGRWIEVRLTSTGPRVRGSGMRASCKLTRSIRSTSLRSSSSFLK